MCQQAQVYLMAKAQIGGNGQVKNRPQDMLVDAAFSKMVQRVEFIAYLFCCLLKQAHAACVIERLSSKTRSASSSSPRNLSMAWRQFREIVSRCSASSSVSNARMKSLGEVAFRTFSPFVRSRPSNASGVDTVGRPVPSSVSVFSLMPLPPNTGMNATCDSCRQAVRSFTNPTNSTELYAGRLSRFGRVTGFLPMNWKWYCFRTASGRAGRTFFRNQFAPSALRMKLISARKTAFKRPPGPRGEPIL